MVAALIFVLQATILPMSGIGQSWQALLCSGAAAFCPEKFGCTKNWLPAWQHRALWL
jgi:hypothetical protein